MPQHRMTKQQKIVIWQAIIFVAIWIIIVFISNIIIFQYFTIFPTQPPPHHTPSQCFQRRFQFCTDFEGKCTKNKKKCVFYPEVATDCKYVVFTSQDEMQQTHKDILRIMRKRKNTKSRDWLIQMDRVYCSIQRVHLYVQILQGISSPLFIWQLILTIIIFFIFLPEIKRATQRLYS